MDYETSLKLATRQWQLDEIHERITDQYDANTRRNPERHRALGHNPSLPKTSERHNYYQYFSLP
jgi:hypothetical protein